MSARLLLAAASAVASVGLLVVLAGAGDDPLEEVDLAARMGECVSLQQQAGDGDISEPAFLCSYEVLRSGILTGRYAQLLESQQVYARPEMWATCHAAGHSLGPDLVAEGMSPPEVIGRLFDGEVQQRPDHFCTAAVIHGVIDGVSRQAQDEDLPDLAAHCGLAGRAHSYYGNECAHYMGHAVWGVYQEIGPAAADACGLLDLHRLPGGMESCLGGAAMEKYELQDAAYGLGSVSVEAPPIGEIRELCRLLEDASARARDGCWGGAGWLLSTHLQQQMNRLHQAEVFDSFPGELLPAAVDIHLQLLQVCESQNCANTLMQHMRPSDWVNGVGRAVCDQTGQGLRVSLAAACRASLDSGILG